MYIFSEQELSKLIEFKTKGIKKERYCIEFLNAYMKNTNQKICCIYGLRRTGKTIMMMQQLQKCMHSGEKSCYILCSIGDDLLEIYHYLQTHPDIQNVFIDEITACDNFLSGSNILSDVFAGIGKRIIVTGTDSLGIALANDRTLYDRTTMIHTTYISYKEYHELLGKNIQEYLRYGGTLTDGTFNYNHTKTDDYTNTAIIDNILHSVDQLADGRENGRLVQLYNEGELKSAIEKTLEINNRKFLARIINRKFKSHDWGSTKELLAQHALPIPQIDEEKFRQKLMTALDIKEYDNIKDSDIDLITSFLGKLDVLEQIGKEIIFTQPGLRYAQLEILLQSLMEPIQDISYIDKESIQDILTHDILGRLYEDVIFYSTYKEIKTNPRYDVLKYTNDRIVGEYDLVVLDKQNKTALVWEIKYTVNVNPNQKKNIDFLSPKGIEMKNTFEKEFGYSIEKSAIIYNGPDRAEEQYENASRFLQELPESILMEFTQEKSINFKEK